MRISEKAPTLSPIAFTVLDEPSADKDISKPGRSFKPMSYCMRAGCDLANQIASKSHSDHNVGHAHPPGA
jgi:hypothetical protein